MQLTLMNQLGVFVFAVSPEKVRIFDESGSNLPHYILGPYNEGASTNVTCVVTGGEYRLYVL